MRLKVYEETSMVLLVLSYKFHELIVIYILWTPNHADARLEFDFQSIKLQGACKAGGNMFCPRCPKWS